MDIEKEQQQILPTNSDKENTNSFGKFRNAEELLKAYNSLEGEFTKRSQKLRELELKAPEKTDWESKVANLYEKWPQANSYTDEMIREIADNKTLLNEESCLENALISVLSKKIVSKEQAAKDEDVVNMVLEKKENKEKIISSYLDTIRTSTLPKTFPKAGGAIPLTPNKPTTLTEAGLIAQKYLEEI
jgi:transcription termination factor NusB